MSQPQTDQEKFWSTDFGDEYTRRNVVDPSDRRPFFARALSRTYGVRSVLELGANKGHNLEAIGALSPAYALTGVELNQSACDEMEKKERLNPVCSTILDYRPDEKFDFVFICGVMIHLNPEQLPDVYERMFQLSNRYVLINEYFNPSPTEIAYRGHTERLFKRDFGGEFWDRHGDALRLVDYGFLWKRVDPAWDDTTWWLFEKAPS